MLHELCRPRTSLGCLFGDTAVACLRQWMASGAPGPALATAAPGSGLTTLVQLLVRETGLDAVWVGCATPRVRALLDHAGANPVSVTMRRKLVVVDEFDALGCGDSSALADALAFARGKPPVPLLFLAHATRSQKTHEFAKSWPLFHMGRPSPAAVAAYLLRVRAAHAPDVPVAEVEALAAAVKGDVRAALTALDLRRRREGAVDVKDEVCDGLDLAEAVLRGERGATVPECLRLFGMEPAVLPMGVHENYLPCLGGGAQDVDAAAAVADAFSRGDLVDRYMYARQAWEVMDVYGAHVVAAASMALRRRRSRVPAGFGITKFGSLWSKMYNTCAKTKNVRALAAAYAEAGRTPLRPCDLAYVRACLKALLQRKAAAEGDDIRRVCAPLTPPLVLALCRLDAGPGGSAWYKQTCHARVKRALEAARSTASDTAAATASGDCVPSTRTTGTSA